MHISFPSPPKMAYEPVLFFFTFLTIATFVLWHSSETRRLRHIPTYGFSLPLLSHWDSLRFLARAEDMIRRAHAVYGDRPFKIALPDRWEVVITKTEHIEDLRKAPDDVLSFHDSVQESLQITYTMGPAVANNLYHIPVIRSIYTMKELPSVFDEMNNEILHALSVVLPQSDEQWSPMSPRELAMDIVARASNRIFVGLPLCRNKEYLDINKQYALDVLTKAAVLKLFPRFIRRLVSVFFSNIEAKITKVHGMINTLVMEYKEHVQVLDTKFKEFEDDSSIKHSKLFIHELLDVASEEEASVYSIARRILAVNFAAIHTTSNAFTHVLLHLADNPTYLQELRSEVEVVVQTYGWTFDALMHMHKIDAFLTESQRRNTMGALIMDRRARKPFVFSDGTMLPAGTAVSIGAHIVQADDRHYENACEFEPWRFEREASLPSGSGTSPAMRLTKTTPTCLGFGHGRLACPGRFFAAMELHLMLAHLVMQFDVKYVDGEHRPPNVWFVSACVPNPKAKILLRKRSSSLDTN
ncbi:cytochrome P450 [Hymenopellis radicata]|nr:cytochrome P450 [Hymenopellis radicata]